MNQIIYCAFDLNLQLYINSQKVLPNHHVKETSNKLCFSAILNYFTRSSLVKVLFSFSEQRIYLISCANNEQIISKVGECCVMLDRSDLSAVTEPLC